jgi:hypothetical protein
MAFLKVLGKKKNFKKNISILYKINQGFFEKKIYIKLNILLLSKKKNNLILLLKKLNLINFFNNNIKFNIFFKSKYKLKNNYNKIFLKYFENKPFFIF